MTQCKLIYLLSSLKSQQSTMFALTTGVRIFRVDKVFSRINVNVFARLCDAM